MTEFETKLLKILEETNTQICNVHTQLYDLDQTMDSIASAIQGIDDVDTGELYFIKQQLKQINETISTTDDADSNFNENLNAISGNLHVIAKILKSKSL